jgi:exodeoxyribonuclease VII small subunit
MSEATPVTDLSYESAFAELETIVASLEAGERPLEDSIALYARGQALIQHCSSLLEKAELQVQQLDQ